MASIIESLGSLRERAARSGAPIRYIVATAIFILALLIFAWLIEKVSVYFLARSYVDEIATAFDLSPHLAKALSWIAYAVTLASFWLVFSFNRRKRLTGMLGMLALLVGHSLLLAYGTQRHVFGPDGSAIKCYVMTRDGMRYGERTGIDPTTGLECRPFTPDMAERLERYANGNRPKRVEGEPNFFDLTTGQPVIWYARRQDGAIELFDLMGYHPESGTELMPVTREVVAAWKEQDNKRRQQAQLRPPTPVDPKTFQLFDPLSGQPRSWYRRSETGAYDFYDQPGFDPRTGEPLTVATREVIEGWRKYDAENPSRRCYVITRDSVRYRDQPGVDPETGRTCKLATPEVLGRLKEYEKGRRPKRVTAPEPVFFDLGNGEPIIWYHRRAEDAVELFDLMGFHPESGAELLPVTREVVELWKQQAMERARDEARKRRPPQRIDANKAGFFDPLTGESRVWAWRGKNGEYEFYDNEGFHPRTGERLTLVTRDVLESWKREEEQLERQRKAEAERTAREQKEREERETRERAERALREDRERREREAQLEKATQAARRCDQLAANPNDLRRAGDGVSYDVLKLQAKEAAESCEAAIKQDPQELRFQYQLGRALQQLDRARAYQIFEKLVRLRYPAAFDNFGWLQVTEKRNDVEAVRFFRMGTDLGDPDSMVSLAEMISRGRGEPRNPGEVKIELYRRAAQLGHAGAGKAYQAEYEAATRLEQERAQQHQAQRQAIELFGQLLQNIPRR